MDFPFVLLVQGDVARERVGKQIHLVKDVA